MPPKVAELLKYTSGQIQDGGRRPKLDIIQVAITPPRIVFEYVEIWYAGLIE